MFGLIYKAINKSNGKLYVGQTTTTLKRRVGQHRSDRRSLLWWAIKKHGIESFEFVQIDTAESRVELDEKERAWIVGLNCLAPVGYNRSVGGVVNSGWHYSEERKAQIAESLRGRRLSDTHKRNISLGQMGRPATFKGRKHTLETKIKMSDAQRRANKRRPRVGRIPSSESRNKMSEAHKGSAHTIEQRKRISLGIKNHWIVRKEKTKLNKIIGDMNMSTAAVPPNPPTSGAATQSAAAPPAPPEPPSASAQLATDVAAAKSDYATAHAAIKADVENLATDTKQAIAKLIADSEAAVGVALPALKALFGVK